MAVQVGVVSEGGSADGADVGAVAGVCSLVDFEGGGSRKLLFAHVTLVRLLSWEKQHTRELTSTPETGLLPWKNQHTRELISFSPGKKQHTKELASTRKTGLLPWKYQHTRELISFSPGKNTHTQGS